MYFKVKNLVLCTSIWSKKHNTTNNDKIDIIINDIKASNYSLSEIQLESIRRRLSNSFLPQYNRLWQKMGRQKDRFIKYCTDFTEKDFEVDFNSICEDSFSHNLENHGQNGSLSKGRPRLSYAEASIRTKKRRIEELAFSCTHEELSQALHVKERNSFVDPPNIDVDDDIESHINNVLAMYVDLRLSKRKYEKLRKHSALIHPENKYPPYDALIHAKRNCHPEDIDVSDSGASVNFISLLDHTTKKLLALLNPDELKKLRDTKLLLTGKWGMDAASGQQTTRQRWTNSRNYGNRTERTIEISDATVLIVSFVPLQLRNDDSVIWTNETPNSPHFCRPIRFEFIKESDSVIHSQYCEITELLQKVEAYNFEYADMIFEIRFDIRCTMIDGKVCNILTQQKSSNRCNICSVGPKLVNDLEHVNSLPRKEDYYKYGLSTLHCWIRFMEYLLHVSYNLDFKKGSARTLEEKELKKARKKKVQNSLKQLSITVDVVKQGAGTSNTGNVARTFFRKAESVAAVTGLNAVIITRLHIILQIITCDKKADSVKFKKYCSKTAKLCVQIYPWYKLPPTVHKILQHGSEVLATFELPIGLYSEEPQEANNKVFRKARAENSRMCCRKKTNIDIMRHMLLLSDPLISSLRIKDEKHKEVLSEEAKTLLLD